ncbi:MAG: MutS-related protein [Brevinematia bacterium]
MKADKITIRDIELFGIYEEGELIEEKGIINIFNKAITKEGRKFVTKYFSSPLPSLSEIEKEQNILKYFLENLDYWNEFVKDMNFYEFDGALKYLNSNLIDLYSRNKLKFFYKASTIKIFYENIFEEIESGIKNISTLIKKANSLASHFNLKKNKALQNIINNLEKIISKKEINLLLNINEDTYINNFNLLKMDHNIRFVFKENLLEIIKIISEIEGRIALAKAFKEYNLTLPLFRDDVCLEVEDCFHPLLKKAIKNSINFKEEKNFLFLTGPNMAGKTTFLKTLGICAYFAHCGFGVPAKSMKLCFFDRLITIINTEENITKSQSYFMGEVKRVKEIVKNIVCGKKCLVLMDELFKGTNFQDAYETTLHVVKKMLEIKSSIFVFSTHIFEISEELKKYKNIMFKCFDAIVENNKIKYNYSLKDGISKEKLGMKILQNEGILDLFNCRSEDEA